jgi:cytochrome b
LVGGQSHNWGEAHTGEGVFVLFHFVVCLCWGGVTRPVGCYLLSLLSAPAACNAPLMIAC